ncbi:hypothetical protein WICANDRAFT_79460 [Wickerhamomyces anomalus NRRL Y-366-8]|uniref:Uncharacterized protein n=1 Tax=Wickerhamomyces anomalus (strain ATCC 58044 / CBS 1984 / NCYC 433 / NRRL Y-366-8) TaxID=683960 RepID=A0A1E3P0K2_WICAA|nr:uncharacterized protein WICANDRAFT_79460 [Wickerhamomyces anomalus NRRL Y-366-8]ODQ58915.1 hypothetical protein WICANDRAFT_79460 [Wickerhamomyces anomalus NRRL Y-366-8]
MNQNQVFTPSGISTRGADLETIPSSSAGLDQDDQQSQLQQDQLEMVSRPLTTNSRYPMVESYSQLIPQPTNNSFFTSSLLDKFQNGSQLTSSSLHLKFSKLIKAEKKKLQKQNDLIKEIQNWCNILTNDECKKLLYNYIKILELEIETFDQLIKKREVINSQLLNVNKREKRTTELKLKRNKILVKLRENENKVGDSPITTLTKENLEELECSVEIVEDQFIRSINTGLRNSLAEYAVTIQNQSCKFKDTSKKFLENYYYMNNMSTNNSTASGNNNNNNLHRLLLQNKLNSAMQMSSRDISTSHTNNPKYVALSPNQIGKYLDNRFNNDPENNSNSSMPPPSSAQPSASENQSRQQQNQSTVINITNEELKSKGITPSHYPSIQPGVTSGPPPTASTPPNQKHHNSGKIEDLNGSNNNSNADNDPTGYTINHYSTPGALGIRPVSSNVHEWT